MPSGPLEELNGLQPLRSSPERSVKGRSRSREGFGTSRGVPLPKAPESWLPTRSEAKELLREARGAAPEEPGSRRASFQEERPK